MHMALMAAQEPYAIINVDTHPTAVTPTTTVASIVPSQTLPQLLSTPVLTATTSITSTPKITTWHTIHLPQVVTSCTKYPPLRLTVENTGATCIVQRESSGLEIHALPQHPEHCLSSTCTRLLEENYEFIVDPKDYTIKLTWRIIAEESTKPGVCSADCNGAGIAVKVIEDLAEGEYEIYIGDSLVGTLQIPLQELLVCFDSYVNFQ